MTYLRLDGSVPPAMRHSIVSRFNADPSIDLLLLSTSVGGLGLNLTGADTVIFVEHDWNPMKDLQVSLDILSARPAFTERGGGDWGCPSAPTSTHTYIHTGPHSLTHTSLTAPHCTYTTLDTLHILAHPCTPPVKSLTIKCLTRKKTYEEISKQGPL